MDPGGGREKRLTFDLGFDTDPAWSPDGTKIAFASARDDPAGDIYVMNTDGSDVQAVTTYDGADTSPAWSPDGKKLVFQTARETEWDLYTINVNGTGEEPIPNGGVSGRSPVWSPAGGKIAYECEGTYAAICTVNTDGTNRVTVTAALYGYEYSPDWSPDGRQIAFSSFPGFEDIWVINADGTSPRNVTQYCCSYLPAWSPDGKQIAFVSDQCIGNDGYCPADGEIFTMGTDASAKHPITNNASGDSEPDWGVVPSVKAASPPAAVGPATASVKCKLRRHLPDRSCTPGATRRHASRKAVCLSKVGAKSISPAIKRQVLARYGLSDAVSDDYKIDHLISRALGGSNSIENLWPQRVDQSRQKNRLERRLRAAVCAGKLGLRTAQRRIKADWLQVYKREFRR